MRGFVAVVLLVLVISALGYAAPAAKYTLYYIDTTHNVSKVGIDSTGHPVGKPKRLTSGGKYDAYSVSPDERYVLGMQNVKPMTNLDGDWTQYIEVAGGSRVAPLMNGKAVWADGLPSVRWALSQGSSCTTCRATWGTPLCFSPSAAASCLSSPRTISSTPYHPISGSPS